MVIESPAVSSVSTCVRERPHSLTLNNCDLMHHSPQMLANSHERTSKIVSLANKDAFKCQRQMGRSVILFAWRTVIS